MPTKWLASEEELREIAGRLCKILPNHCPREENTLMYARFFMRNAKWIYYIGAWKPFDGNPMFLGYCTNEPGWMPWYLSQMTMSFQSEYVKDALEIFPTPIPLSELLKLPLAPAPE